MSVEFVLLILSLLFFASIFTDKIGYKFGVPALLLFLAVGMLFGPNGIGAWLGSSNIGYMLDVSSAQAIGTVALCVILFSGGLDTKISDIQPVIAPGLTLATIGVLLTCVITGVLIWLIFGWTHAIASVSIWVALLMAATMSSTDSASVFSILRTNGIKLKHNLRPLLELESGANDPMAYILTITLIEIVKNQPMEISALTIFQDILVQLVMGAVMGFIFAKLIVWLLNRVDFSNESLYPIMVLTACIFIFACTYYLRGNPYLAVYIGGLIIGNSKFTRKRQTKSFFDGLTWLSQLVMFLMLGLMVKPLELFRLEVWLSSFIISLVMICISRPLSVVLCMLPFRKFKQVDRLFTSWVGLKGAVPIIFAILCVANGVPHADLLYNVVFMCTLVSLLVQGTTLSAVARKLKLALPAEKQNKLQYFDLDLPEEIESSARERLVDEALLKSGNKLKEIAVPEHTLVIMVRRENTFFVPKGDTELQLGDRLLVISDNNAEKVVQDLEEEETAILTHWWMDFTRHTGRFIKARWKKLIESQNAEAEGRKSEAKKDQTNEKIVNDKTIK
ncbi:MAG: potassium/proton antiporter [Paludibacteraceae bacterium]|nr:potassium/proton antiporter [Paludibacteraceae bacterium]